MTYSVSKGAAYAVLYSVLLLFSFLAVGAAGWFSCLPDSLTRFWTLRRGDGVKQTADYFLAARSSAGPWTIALSFFASGMGAWVRPTC